MTDFTAIDISKWPRGEVFYYFSQMAPTGYSLTVEMDVTALLQTVKSNNIKFFPAYLWLVTKNLNKQIELKIAQKDGQLSYYHSLTPLYAHFHNDNKTFSLMWTEYNDDFHTFYKSYLDNQKQYGENYGVLAQKHTLPPQNAYTVSAIPWVKFKSFAVHSYENKPYFFPSVEAGKYFEQSGKILMPLSLTCHHATTDGWHIDLFLKDLQADMDNFEKYF